jgi:hypothetical protein
MAFLYDKGLFPLGDEDSRTSVERDGPQQKQGHGRRRWTEGGDELETTRHPGFNCSQRLSAAPFGNCEPLRNLG